MSHGNFRSSVFSIIGGKVGICTKRSPTAGKRSILQYECYACENACICWSAPIPCPCFARQIASDRVCLWLACSGVAHCLGLQTSPNVTLFSHILRQAGRLEFSLFFFWDRSLETGSKLRQKEKDNDMGREHSVNLLGIMNHDESPESMRCRNSSRKFLYYSSFHFLFHYPLHYPNMLPYSPLTPIHSLLYCSSFYLLFQYSLNWGSIVTPK